MKKTSFNKKIVIISALLLLAAFVVGRLTVVSKSDENNHQHDVESKSDKETINRVWTCSMHPQIKMPKQGKCPLCGMDLIPLESSSDDTAGMRELSVSKYSAKLMEIETAPVEEKFVSSLVRMVGQVDYDETRVSYITAWIPGRLDRLFVDYTGILVKKGDHMVSLYSPELISAQEELLQAVAATKQLAKSDVSIVRQTTSDTIEATREKLRLWGLSRDQIKNIEKNGKPEDHITIYAPASGIVVHKNAQEGMYVKTGMRIYTIADLSQVWVNLDAYESDLEWIRYGQKVEFTVEAFPGEVFAGRISFIQPILDKASRTVKVRVNVANRDGRLKPGMFVRGLVKSLLAASGRVTDPSFVGKWICPMHPDVVKDAAGDCDICDMPLVTAESLGYIAADRISAEKPLVIPVSAALLTGTRAIVYVEIPGREKPTFEGREIVLGPRAGDYYIVKSGLNAGERVVIKGAFMLDAELQIQAKPSMMTPQGGGGGGMAGMDHGEKNKKLTTDDMAAMTAGSLKLDEKTKEQLHAVVMAAENAVKVAGSGDISVARIAFEELGDTLLMVWPDLLKDKAVSLWREHSMFLQNDAAEGQDVKTEVDVNRVALSLRSHIDGVKKAFGIMVMPAMDKEDGSHE